MTQEAFLQPSIPLHENVPFNPIESGSSTKIFSHAFQVMGNIFKKS